MAKVCAMYSRGYVAMVIFLFKGGYVVMAIVLYVLQVMLPW